MSLRFNMVIKKGALFLFRRCYIELKGGLKL